MKREWEKHSRNETNACDGELLPAMMILTAPCFAQGRGFFTCRKNLIYTMVLTILSLVSSENCVDIFTAKRIIYVKWTSVGCPVCVSYVVCVAIIVNQFQLSGALS